MIILSAVILTKNEENTIEDCIKTLNFCDEVIVIDSGSTDQTVSIAQKNKAKVIRVPFTNFSDLRNKGLTAVSGKWILYIDADERVSKELKDEIIKVIKGQSQFSAYRLNRKNYYLGNHEWPHKEKLERLFLKNDVIEWFGMVHESPKIKGEVGELSGYLLHFTHKDLSSMVKKTIEWSQVEAQIRYNAGHPQMKWWRFPRVMISAFWEYYVVQRGYLVGAVGLIESIYQSFSMFITYARLWELQNKK